MRLSACRFYSGSACNYFEKSWSCASIDHSLLIFDSIEKYYKNIPRHRQNLSRFCAMYIFGAASLDIVSTERMSETRISVTYNSKQFCSWNCFRFLIFTILQGLELSIWKQPRFKLPQPLSTFYLQSALNQATAINIQARKRGNGFIIEVQQSSIWCSYSRRITSNWWSTCYNTFALNGEIIISEKLQYLF